VVVDAVVDVVVGAAVVVVVVVHSPSVSPCATWAATAGRAIVIVCCGFFVEPVWWHTATFSWPRPSASPVVVPGVVAVVVRPPPTVDVVSFVDVEPFSFSFSFSFSSPCSSWSSADSFSRPVDCVVEDCVVVVVLTAETVGEGPLVIWARPTPAAAANASPTIAPTMERRLNRLNQF
jgi:hypothetical protein